MKTENTAKQYTPGCWQKIRRHDGRPCVVTLDENDNLEHVVAGPSTTLHNEQDLQLISAAPELLEALKETLDKCKVQLGHEHYLGCACSACQTYRKAKTAIAKAEGLSHD